MKNFFKYAAIVLMLAVPVLSLAAEFRAGEQASIGKSEKIASDVYIAGGSVMSAGDVSGDLLVGGGNIVISGDVGADLIVGGGNITILSDIGDSIRAGGGTIVIEGKVKKDVVVGGGQIIIGGSGIGGDVIAGGGSIRVESPVAGNLFIGGKEVYINAPIGGNVKIEAEKITLGSNAVIEGNLTYRSSEEIIKETGAVIKGTVDFKLIEKSAISQGMFAAIFSAFLLWKFFALLACALVVGLVLRRFSKEIISLSVERPWVKLAKGIIVVIVTPVLSVFLFTTIVGIPFGVLGLLGFIILMLFSWIVTPILVGSFVYRYFSKKELEVSWKTIVLGVFLYVILGIVPFVGNLIQMLLTFLTLGSIVALKMKILKEWR